MKLRSHTSPYSDGHNHTRHVYDATYPAMLVTHACDLVGKRIWLTNVQRLLQNPFVRAILFRGLWQLVRLLMFRR